MDGVVFQLAVVFTPGLIWVAIVDALCVTGERSALRVSLRSFGFGLASYLTWFTLYYLGSRLAHGVWPTVLDLLVTAPAVGDLHTLRAVDILGASGLAAGLAVAWAWAANRNLFHRVMRRLRVTAKYWDESLWEFWLSSRDPANEFVNFRDTDRGLTFSGFVRIYSEAGSVRELLLERVRGFDSATAQFLYDVPTIYLSRKADNLHLEFPLVPRLEAEGVVSAAGLQAAASQPAATAN